MVAGTDAAGEKMETEPKPDVDPLLVQRGDGNVFRPK